MAVQQLFWLISQSAHPDESCLIFSEKIVQALFLSEFVLAREVYVLVIRRLADFSKPLSNELAEWFMYSMDLQKYNIPVILAFLRADLISCLELDLHLARQLESGSENFLAFVCDIVSECCLSPNAFYSYIDFLYIVEGLGRLKSRPAAAVKLLNDVNATSAILKLRDTPKDNLQAIAASSNSLFKEWYAAFCHPASSDAFQLEFVTKVF
jgi:CCR4-NOT transcription complex subunit 1